MDHGRPNSRTRHVGDLGNIVSTTSTGITNILIIDNAISLQEEDVSSILDRSIVIHQQPDNFAGSSGNAGPRISCGVIGEGISNIKLYIAPLKTYRYYYTCHTCKYSFSTRIELRMSVGLHISERGCPG